MLRLILTNSQALLSFQRLRNENRLLKKRNELLEAESTELANRLVRGQVSRAEEEETKFVKQFGSFRKAQSIRLIILASQYNQSCWSFGGHT